MPTNFLFVFNFFVGLALKGSKEYVSNNVSSFAKSTLKRFHASFLFL